MGFGTDKGPDTFATYDYPYYRWYNVNETEYHQFKGWELADNPGFDATPQVNHNSGWAEEHPDYKSETFGRYIIHGMGSGVDFSEWYYKFNEGITDKNNPATTAGLNAVRNALMGLLVNPDFYGRLLEQGYVYKRWETNPFLFKTLGTYQGKEHGLVIPAEWYNILNLVVNGGAPLYNPNYLSPLFPIKGAPTIGDTPWDKSLIYNDPEPPPKYGTYFKPCKGAKGEYVNADTGEKIYPQGAAAANNEIPNQGNGMIPGWAMSPSQTKDPAVNWSVTHKHDLSLTQAFVGGDHDGGAYVYKARIGVIGEDFVEFLEEIGILVHDPAQAFAAVFESQKTVTEADAQEDDFDNPQLVTLGYEEEEVVPTLADTLSEYETKDWKKFLKDNLPAAEEQLPALVLPTPTDIQAAYPDATHYVLVRGTTGMPPQPKITLEAKNMPVKGKSKAGTLVSGDAVIVVKEFVGDNGEWHKIKVLQADSPLGMLLKPKKSYYVNSKSLVKLPNAAPSLDRIYKCERQKKLESPDWTKMQNKEVFFDKGKCNYCIVIEPINPNTDKKYINIGDNELEEAKQYALGVGLVELLKYYNKHMFIDEEGGSNRTVEKILGAFAGPYVGKKDWYLDKRPKSKLKILVKFPSKYFDALPEAPEDFRGIAHTSTATLALESSDEEIAFVKDIYSLRTVHFVLPTLRKKIHIISNLMEFYAKKMDKWLGKIPAFDLRKEKQRLEDFSLILFRFLRLNGIIVDKKEEDTIELGFNNMFELQYVLVNKAGFASPLRIGFERFKNTEPINITRTMAYVFYLDELIREARKKTKIGWVEFVQKYTFPVPEIRPSSLASAIDSVCAGTKGTKKEFAKKISATYDEVETYTSKGMVAAQKRLNNPTLKTELINIRKIDKSFVGDEFTRQIPDLIKKIDSFPTNLDGINELYNSVLNKTDIKNLASLAASAEVSKMPAIDVSVSLGEFALEEMTTEEVTNLFNSFPEDTKTKINVRMEEIEMGINIESADSFFFVDEEEEDT